eukprot:4687-Heterococcus_DN1.PRE.2
MSTLTMLYASGRCTVGCAGALSDSARVACTCSAEIISNEACAQRITGIRRLSTCNVCTMAARALSCNVCQCKCVVAASAPGGAAKANCDEAVLLLLSYSYVHKSTVQRH